MRPAPLPAATRIAAADALAERMAELPELLTDDKVAGYWAVHGELPLHRVVTALVRRGAQYHLPVVCDGERLRFAPWSPGKPLAPNRYGIPEPVVKSVKSAAAPESIEAESATAPAFDVSQLPPELKNLLNWPPAWGRGRDGRPRLAEYGGTCRPGWPSIPPASAVRKVVA